LKGNGTPLSIFPLSLSDLSWSGLAEEGIERMRGSTGTRRDKGKAESLRRFSRNLKGDRKTDSSSKRRFRIGM